MAASTVATTEESLPPVDLDVSPGVEQLTIVGLEPGEQVTVVDARTDEGADAVADTTGALIVRNLDAGGDYTVFAGGGQDGPFEVMSRRRPSGRVVLRRPGDR